MANELAESAFEVDVQLQKDDNSHSRDADLRLVGLLRSSFVASLHAAVLTDGDDACHPCELCSHQMQTSWQEKSPLPTPACVLVQQNQVAHCAHLLQPLLQQVQQLVEELQQQFRLGWMHLGDDTSVSLSHLVGDASYLRMILETAWCP